MKRVLALILFISLFSNNSVAQIVLDRQPLAAVCKDGRWGYINTSGAIVIPCQFEDVGDFHEGFAYVSNGDGKGFINLQGEIVVPCQFEDVGDFHEGFAKVSNDNGYGFINTQGEIVVPCQFYDASDFYDGIAIVRDRGKDLEYKLINSRGEDVIPDQFFQISDFSDGLAWAIKDEETYGFIDTKGVFTYVDLQLYDSVNPFHEGLSQVLKDFKYGFINAQGEIGIPCHFDDAGDFHEGLAWVETDDSYGFINTRGELQIPYQFELVEDFHEGLARIAKPEKVKDAVVSNLSRMVFKEFINPDGKIVLTSPYEINGDFHNGFARVKNNGKEGFIDRTGKLVIPCTYDYAQDFCK